MNRLLLTALAMGIASVALAQTVGVDGVHNVGGMFGDGIHNGSGMIGPPPANPCSSVLGGTDFSDPNGCNIVFMGGG